MRFLIIILLCGCSHSKGPQPSDTAFDPEKRDWAAIYAHELKVAEQNGDYDALRFFWPEFVKELHKKIKK